MKSSTGTLLIAFGLVLLYAVLSDKYPVFVKFGNCLLDRE